MSRRPLIWKIAPAYLSVTLLTVIAVGWLAVRGLRGFYLEHTRDALAIRARFLEVELPPAFPNTAPDTLQQFCVQRKKLAEARITLVARDGRVLGDSDSDPKRMENHARHPEVRSALAGEPSFDVRYSISVHKNVMYFALPIKQGGDVVGVLRTSLPLTTFESALNSLIGNIVVGAAVVLVLACVVTVVIFRRLNRPIVEMVRGADRYAAGDFSQRLRLPDETELASLAATLNRMAAELDMKIRELTAQRNEQQVVLASMREGVLSVDADERILFMNDTAAEFFDVDRVRAKGCMLQERVRQSDVQRFVRHMLEEEAVPAPVEITLPSREDQVIQLSGSALLDGDGRRIGVLIVLNDITRLRQLEGLRQEFVANVSHELKTPITAIKGFVETLREGALEDGEHARAFLERISQNADRLDALIDDLLSLSRIEQDVEREEVKLVPGSLRDIVQSAVESCTDKAAQKQIALLLITADDLPAMVNATLLEQAVINLIDNAIKYSEPGRSVEVELVRSNDTVGIRVRDHGCGITPEHMARIFERFYRVDKARSRKLGGTGLGLAIVKHIVQAHGGTVSVESTPGEGSSFTISLPVA